jgi:hypothetical protein
VGFLKNMHGPEIHNTPSAGIQVAAVNHHLGTRRDARRILFHAPGHDERIHESAANLVRRVEKRHSASSKRNQQAKQVKASQSPNTAHKA